MSGTDPLDKIAGEDLRRLAAADSPQRASVVVEVALPAAQVEFEPGERGQAPRWAPRRVGAESPEQQHRTEETVAAARAFLTALVGSQPVWLAAAGAFVVEATGAQLRAMAGSPLVRSVHANRPLRPPPGPTLSEPP